MDSRSNAAATDRLPNAADDKADEQSLQQLIAGTRDLYTQTAEHWRDIGKLAFMELELATTSFPRWILAVALFCTSGLLACVFGIAALLIVFTNATFSPIAGMLLLAGLCGGVAGGLFLYLRTLSHKLMFRALRDQLTRPQGSPDVETR